MTAHPLQKGRGYFAAEAAFPGERSYQYRSRRRCAGRSRGPPSEGENVQITYNPASSRPLMYASRSLLELKPYWTIKVSGAVRVKAPLLPVMMSE